MKQSWLDKAVNRVFGIYGPEHGDKVVTWYDTSADDDSEPLTGHSKPQRGTPDEEWTIQHMKLSACKDGD